MTAHYIRLRSGGFFDFDGFENSVFTIEDIAWGLAHINRFNGQTHRPISVAQHSINVSYLVDPKIALAALMHDAAEAFIGDITTPLKALLGERLGAIERMVEYVIAQKFNLTTHPANPHIKLADLVCLATERKLLMGNDPGEPWGCLKGISALQLEDISHQWTLFNIGGASTPRIDYENFLKRYEELNSEAHL